MNRTLRAATMVAVLGLGAGTAWAQASWNAYVFGTPGQFRASGFSTTTFHAGGGGELLLGGRVGLGAEVGYLGPTESFGDGLGILSTNASVNFGSGNSPVVPFVTAGYSRLFDDAAHQNGWNVGGGVNYWFARRAGLRVEFRDHIYSDEGTTGHFWGARFGITLR